jgi:hypothetical protein
MTEEREYGGFLEWVIPKNEWFIMENPAIKWMILGTTILGNPIYSILGRFLKQIQEV